MSGQACGSCWQDNYQYAIYTRLRMPKLYKYALEGSWDMIPQRCKTHPKESKFVHKYAPMDTPLHRVLRTESCVSCPLEMQQNIYDMKQDAVRALLEANPAQASTTDTFQRTPLHWACMDIQGNFNSQDDSVLLELIDRAPQAARVVDIEQRTPLHYLVARNDEIPLPLLAKLVALAPETVSLKDEVGDTPMDIIQSRKEEMRNADEVFSTLNNLKSMLISPA